MPPGPMTPFEHAYYIGNYIGAILYGIELVLYFCTISAAYQKGNTGTPKNRLFVVVFSTSLLLLVTIDISVNATWGDEMWITFRDRPGGVSAFLETQLYTWYQVLGTTACILLIFMGDGLLIYRLFKVWEGSYLIVVLPILAHFAAFALGIIQIIQNGDPNHDFFQGKVINFGIPYYALTITLNITITLLICIRLHLRARQISKLLGPENAKLYTGIMAMMIESGAPYTASGIMVLAFGGPTLVLPGQIWTKMSCISPQWVILRVVLGRAYDQDTIDRMATQLNFPHTRRSEVSQMEHHDGTGAVA